MIQLTEEILEGLGFQRGKREGRIFFQKGNVLVIYEESGVWEFAAEHGIPMSSGMIITSLEELEKLMQGHE